MTLHFFDWILIVAYIALTIIIGLIYKNQAGKSLADFFLGGRSIPWYIAGISMVATTFAADTPLAVTELVAQGGISANWLWWNMLIGGMLTTFFFAKLWRRAEVLTELEFIELRYSGRSAAFLRGFKAVYLGVFMNTLIIGWVNIALITILEVFFEIPSNQLIWYVAIAMFISVIYSSMSGLKGVAITDAVQFVIAMTGSIILAVVILNTEKIGGVAGLKAQLPNSTFNFFPEISFNNTSQTVNTLVITFGAFLAYIGVQWWSSWYPGAEPGGGGYVAQRMLSTKDENHSVWATLFFQIAHYALRPWPWILVGLASLVLYPDLPDTDKRLGYIMAIKDYMPIGLKGLMLVALLAAYMSTISTQLNWGASYIVNDLYKRFMLPESKKEDQRHLVLASRITTFLIMFVALYVTTIISSITEVWKFILECGAGLGLVLILRWYWSRINAWSEISAMIIPFFTFAILRYIFNIEFPDSFFYTVSITTIGWLIITYVTKPDSLEHLTHFYNKVKPDLGWNKFRINEDKHTSNKFVSLIIQWISAIALTYSMLFFIGDIILKKYSDAIIWIVIAATGFVFLYINMKKKSID